MHGHLPLYEYYSKCVACDSFNLGVRIELGGFHQRGFVVAVPSIHKTSRVVALGIDPRGVCRILSPGQTEGPAARLEAEAPERVG